VDGQLEKSVATHLKAAQLKPDNEIAHYNLSLAYHRLENCGRAIAHGEKAVTLEPSNPHPWVALAMVNGCQNQPSEARKNYQQAISLDPRYREGWFLEHLQEAGFSTEQVKQVQQLRQAALRG
jgi:Flp pilus assembly protein TadD